MTKLRRSIYVVLSLVHTERLDVKFLHGTGSLSDHRRSSTAFSVVCFIDHYVRLVETLRKSALLTKQALSYRQIQL